MLACGTVDPAYGKAASACRTNYPGYRFPADRGLFITIMAPSIDWRLCSEDHRTEGYYSSQL